MKDCLLIYSGGLDSTTMLYEYKDRIALALSFNYGSNHNEKELQFAKENCERLGIEWLCINLTFMHDHFRSSLLEGSDAIPEGHYNADNMKSTVVPFRNGIMLSVACGLAESRELRYVMIANHGGDHNIYPDCRPEFITAISEAMQKGTDTQIEIFAPYTNISKADIVRHGAEIGVDYSHTWSCYKGGKKHCGKCGTCIERHEAFELAGIKDPTEYEN
ncbi:MAG: 7-cyano-7-deazaguanine synthase QueC [Paludibacteraceae bacterium]|nr:7-cyano-7-deazaguanine synthase QueC [Paludibacteraceae bacterium]